MTITLYSHPMSPCSQKVRIVLAEKSLPWTKIDVDLPNKANLSEDYLRLNPLGVVPTLVEDDQPVIESSVICEYLDDRYSTPRLRPQEPLQIASMRNWMKHVDNKVHPSCGALQWPLVMADKLKQMSEAQQEKMINQVIEKPRRERQRRLLKFGYDAPDVVDAVATYEKTFRDLDKILAKQDYIAGNEFSLADAAMAPYFQTPWQFGWRQWYEHYKHASAWYQRCRDRESYQSAVTQDFSDAKLADLKARGASAWEKIQAHLQVLRA